MARPNNFWDVLSETANYASEAIPAAQRQNREMAQEQQRFGLRAQNERDQFNETRRYHDAQIGLQSARSNRPQSHPAENPSFEKVLLRMAQNPEEFTPEQIKDFKEAAAEFYDMRRQDPQPKEWQQPPNFIGDISSAADLAVGRNAGLRQKEGTTTIIPGVNGGPSTYAPPTTPVLTRDQALQQQFDLRSGMMPRYHVKPDSVRAGLRMAPVDAGGYSHGNPRVPVGAPSSNMGAFRMMDRPTQQPVDLSTLSDEELDALERQISGQ